MITEFSQLAEQWKCYRFRVWIAHASLAWIVACCALLGGLLLQISPAQLSEFALQATLLFILSLEWGRIHASEEACLKRLYRAQPSLAESLHTMLDFQKATPHSSGEAYFQKKYLTTLANQLKKAPLTRLVSLKGNFLSAFILMGLIVGFLGWQPQLQGFLPNSSPTSSPTVQDNRSYRILYPAYIRKPPTVLETLPPQLPLPRGSRLEIYFDQEAIDDSLQNQSFYLVDTEKTPLYWLAQKERWMASISPLESGTLHLSWEGLESDHKIEVVKDQPPELTVTWPQQKHIFSNSSLPITFSVTDDYGLQQITLHYQIKGKSQEAPHQEIIQAFEGQFTEYTETYTWELGSTALRQGDEVVAWLEASDNDVLYGPNVTVSDKFEFTVGSIQKFHEDLMERLQKLVADLGELLFLLDRKLLTDTLKKEQAIIKELAELRADFQYDSLMTDELRLLLFSEMQGQILFYQKRRLQLTIDPI